MLPSNPRAGGLPNNPRSSGPGGRRREQSSRGEDNDSPAISSRPSRYQRPPASSRRGPSRSRVPNSYDQPSRRSNDSSTSSSSVSSSGGSFLERMKNGSSDYASSVTTIEDVYENDNRKANVQAQDHQDDQQDGESAQTAGDGYGWTIWSRVATAAGSLTVNVSKAWASNIATYAGEETPPGQESRLTRAMKAYHLEKARDPTDLPAWLFDEHERRPRHAHPREREDKVTTPRETKPSTSPPQSAPPRGLRNVYDAASTPANVHQSSSANPTPINRGAARKGTDRLRALREAKRVPGNNTYVVQESEEVERPTATIPQAPRARVGLPGGPARNRRV